MRVSRPWLLAVLALVAAAPVHRRQPAPPPPEAYGPPPPPTPYDMCEDAIAAARTRDIPATLLSSIARVESGRLDPVAGRVRPWPWTINVDGVGSFYDSKEQVIATVQALQTVGKRSIDVGCMQVNLMYHPDAFATLDAAFDPPTNAAYAVKFLTALHAQTKDWALATAWYHSQTQDRGEEYQRLVFGKVVTPMGPAKPFGIWPPINTQFGAFAPSSMMFGAFAAPPLAGYDLLGKTLRRNQSTTRR